MRYTWATASHVGHVRSNNEDVVFPSEDGSASGPVVVGVADGMGGAAAGEVASRTAMEAATAFPPSNTEMADRVLAGNEAVLAAVNEDPALAGMGTTMTIGVFDDAGSLHLGHVGDSRGYLLRDGEIRQLTHDHTYVMELVTRGQIPAEEAAHHPRRHLLTRVVGMDGLTPDATTLELRPRDRIVMCSDGITDMVPDDTMLELLATEDSASGAAWALIEAANAAGGVDNSTVAVVDVDP